MSHIVLEYDKLKGLLKQHTLSDLGSALVDQLQPSHQIDDIQYQQRLCSEVKNHYLTSNGFSLRGIQDITAILENASRLGPVLHIDQLLRIARFAEVAKKVKAQTRKIEVNDHPILTDLTQDLPTFPELLNETDRCLTPEGDVLDSASPTLKSIRRRQANLYESIHNHLSSILKSPNYQKSIQENIITSRNNRFVIPIKQEHKSNLNGIVHGQSASGATVFVEPLEVIEKNNQLLQLTDAEQEEIRRILRALSEIVHENVFGLTVAQQVLADLEFQTAKAKLSQQLNAVEPVLNTEGYLELIEARHPLLEINLQENPTNDTPKEIIPTNIHIGDEFNTIVITGPNTGGKTVVLKTVGLLALMAQSGLHIPAQAGSQLPIFEQIFADIGDEQSIEQNLSTFSSHITKIVAILNAANENTLVMLDEIGAGTDPTEGTALGMAIIDHLSRVGAKTITTTHYSALKAFAHDHEEMTNASMEFDWETLSPTYRLQLGVPGSSNAIKIAKRLGMPTQVLDAANAKIGQQSVAVENLIVGMQESQRQLDRQQQLVEQRIRSAEATKTKYERLISKFEAESQELQQAAEKEAAEILKQARRLVENTIFQIRQKEASKEGVRSAFTAIEQAQEELKRKRSTPQKTEGQLHTAFSVRPGDKVLVKDLDQFGEVLSVSERRKKPIRVQVGTMQLSLSYHDISQPAPEAQQKMASASVLTLQHRKTSSVSSELNLIGQKVDPALETVDKYLDDAYLAGLLEIRLIHGKGTGALGSAIHDFLRAHLLVTHFSFATANQGGSGATQVKLKE